MVATFADGTPVFQVFNEDGEEITAHEGPLSAGVCAECHTDPSCVNGGQCGTIE
jgi:hypothetical protein